MADEYIVPIGVGDGFSSEIDKAINGVERLDKAAADANKNMATGMKKTAEATGAVEKNVNKSRDAMGRFVSAGKQVETQQKAIGKANKDAFDEKPANRFTRILNSAKGVAKEFWAGMKEGAKQARTEIDKTNDSLGEGKGGKGGGGGLLGMLKQGAGLFAGFFAVSAIVSAGKEIFRATADFQKFEEVLTISLGDRSEAQKAMRQIADFAAKTPFAVDELTNSFVKLANRGFIPTTDELTKLGDLASSQGKSFDQLTEALLDAQSGEFERLKEFGIKGAKAGDQVTLSFGNFSKTIKNNEEDIRNTILEIGKLPQVAGGMEAISKTLEGQFSNLQDNVGALFRTIGGEGTGAFTFVLEKANEFISFLNTGLSDGSFAQFFRPLIEGVQAFYDKVQIAIDSVMKWAESSGFLDSLKDTFSDIVTIAGNLLSFLGDVIVATVEWAQQDGIIQNSIGGAIKFVWNLIRGVISAIAEIPFYWEAAKAGLNQFVDNAKNKFQIFLNDLRLIKAEVQLAFTFDDDKEAALRDKINKLTEDNERRRQQIKGAGVAFDEKLAELRKKQADKEAAEEAERQKKLNAPKDNSPVKGRAQGAKPAAAGDDKEAKKAADKAAKDAKEQNDRLIKLANQLRDAEIEGIKDVQKAKEEKIKEDLRRATAELDAELAKINKKKSLSEKDLQEIELINKVKAQLAKNSADELQKIAEDAAKAKFELENAARMELLNLQKDSAEKEIALIDAQTEDTLREIRKKYEGQADIIAQLEAATQADAERRKKEIRDEAALQKISDSQEVEELLIELSAAYIGDYESLEEQKQLAILEVRKKYAEKQLEELRKQGKDENDLAVLQAKKTIKDLDKEIKAAKEAAKGQSLFDVMGISEEDFDRFKERFDLGMQLITDFTNMLVDAAQQELDRHDEKIGQYEDEIDELENKVDKEQELADKGLANDLTRAQLDLAEKKKQRDAEVKQKEETQKKLDKLQKIQLIADTVAQTSGLITSAANIFKAFSAIPIVGVPLAIAAIGLMFGTFAAAKVKAFQAIGKKRQGGFIDAPSHEQGGRKYFSEDGKGVELEGGEYVTNTKATSKYLPILRAINENKLSSLSRSERSFRDMLGEMGIVLSDEVKQAPNDFKQVQEAQNSIIFTGAGSKATDALLEKIEANTAYFVDKDKTRWEVIYEDDHEKVLKQGSKTRRIIKKQKV